MTKGKENDDPNYLITDAWSRNWCVPIILLMLRQWNAHGYELMDKLTAFGVQALNPGTFYRTLRQMEKNGMVSSTWDNAVAGPARRVYSITQAGEGYLKFWATSLDQYQRMMNTFFELYPWSPAQHQKEDD